MKVLAVTPGPMHVSPGQRYRIEQWETTLAKQGISITYSPFLGQKLGEVLYQRGHTLRKAAGISAAYARQLGAVSKAARFDLVYLFREAALIGPAVIERLIAFTGKPIVFDFDDAVFVRYRSPSNPFWGRLKFPGKTATLCRKARLVMAGNRYLADYASRFNGDVTIVPTTIDTELYRPERRSPRVGHVPTIGWTGSHSTVQHLKCIVPALSELARRCPFRFVVVGADAPSVPGVEVEARAWSADTEVEDLSDIDIGIMPLPDEPWTRGKCGFKALQYMGLGIPAVVSPVGVNTEIVADGENGFLASTDKDWIDRLTKLMRDCELRNKLGAAARRTVEARYSASVVAPNVAKLLQEAAGV